MKNLNTKLKVTFSINQNTKVKIKFNENLIRFLIFYQRNLILLSQNEKKKKKSDIRRLIGTKIFIGIKSIKHILHRLKMLIKPIFILLLFYIFILSDCQTLLFFLSYI